MKPRKRGIFWEARWTRADGSEGTQPGFKTPEEAKEFADEKRIQAKRDRRAGIFERKGKELTLQQYVVGHYSATLNVKKRTAGDYEISLNSHILPKFGKYPLSRITPEEIEKWRVELIKQVKENGEPYSPKTLEKIESHLCTILKQAVNYEYLVKNPFNKVDRKFWRKKIRKRTPKVLTFEQLLLIVENLPEALRALIWLGFFTGMRPAELLGLTWDRIDFEKKTITVDRQIYLSTDEVFDDELKSRAAYRTIDLDDELARILIEHRNKFGLGPHELLFRNRDGQVLRYKAALRFFNRAARPIGVPVGDSLHLLRHTCVSHLILIGWRAFEIQHHVGHATYQETMDTYGHLLKRKERFQAHDLGAFYRYEMSKRGPKFTLLA
jgi:integrase